MAEDNVVQEKVEEKEDGTLRGTQEAFQAMFDAGGEETDKYLKAFDEGKIELIEKKEDAEPGTKTDAEPGAKSGPEPKKEELNLEEDLTFTVKRKQLGDYKNLGEALKGAVETKNFSKFQKERITELERQLAEIKESVPTSKKEADDLKKEKESLEDRIKELENKKPEPVATKIEEIVTFDEIPEVDDESAFEPKNMRKLYGNFGKAVKTINQLHSNLVSMQKENVQLKADAQETKTIATELKSTTSEFLKKHETASEKANREREEEKLFSNLAELQTNHEDLKTKEDLRKIDNEYIGFQENLFRMVKADSADKMSAVLNSYLYDSSEVGDKIRKQAEENGILPPDEIGVYLNLRQIARVANSSTILGDNGKPRPFTLEEAYSHVQKDTGAYNKDVAKEALDKNKQFLAAKQNRDNTARTMDADVLNDAPPPVEEATVDNVTKIIEKYSYGQIKDNPVLKKAVEKVLPDFFDEVQ